jgi:hypothetical protein
MQSIRKQKANSKARGTDKLNSEHLAGFILHI